MRRALHSEFAKHWRESYAASRLAASYFNSKLPCSTTTANYPLADSGSVCGKWSQVSHSKLISPPARVKMKKLMCLLLLALPLSIHAEDQKPISTATICFYRPHRFEGSALKPPLFVDDIDVAHLHNGDAVEIVVLAGPHRVNSNDKSTGIDLDAKAGQTYYIRVDIKAGAWKGHGAITLVDPQQGKYEFSK